MKFTIRPIKDGAITPDNVWDIFEALKKILGADELLNALAKALGSEKLIDLLIYIVRVYDLSLEEVSEDYLVTDAKNFEYQKKEDVPIDVNTLDMDSIYNFLAKKANRNDEFTMFLWDQLPNNVAFNLLKEIFEDENIKYKDLHLDDDYFDSANFSHILEVLPKYFKRRGNPDAVLQYANDKLMMTRRPEDVLDIYKDFCYTYNIPLDKFYKKYNKFNDDLKLPGRAENYMAGQGHLTAKHEKYKDFTIWQTEEGKYDVYDKYLSIWGTGYENSDAAKVDIDKAYNDPVLSKAIGKKPVRRSPKRSIAIDGSRFSKYEESGGDVFWELSKGGLGNKDESSSIGEFDTLEEALNEAIDLGYVKKESVFPSIGQYEKDIAEYDNYIDSIKNNIADLEYYIEKHAPVEKQAKEEKDWDKVMAVRTRLEKTRGRLEHLRERLENLESERLDAKRRLDRANHLTGAAALIKKIIKEEGGILPEEA